MRHELKDGKWYLIKVKGRYLTFQLEKDDFVGGNKSLFGKTTVEHLIEDEAEWVEIDPEKIFNSLKSEQDKSYSEIKDKK